MATAYSKLEDNVTQAATNLGIETLIPIIVQLVVELLSGCLMKQGSSSAVAGRVKDTPITRAVTKVMVRRNKDIPPDKRDDAVRAIFGSLDGVNEKDVLALCKEIEDVQPDWSIF